MGMMRQSVPSREVQPFDSVRFKQAKASIDSPSESSPIQVALLDRLASIKEAALLTAHGSKKAASIEVGCDQSQMNRQLRMGTFDTRQEAAAGEAYLAALGELLVEAFSRARKSKKQIALEQLPRLMQLMLDAATEE